jgi:hypothetical protein
MNPAILQTLLVSFLIALTQAMAAERTKTFDPDEHARLYDALQAKARTLTEAELQRLAQDVLSAGENSETYALLKFAGARSVPFALELLRKEEALRPDSRDPRRVTFPNLNLILSLLRDYAPTQAVQYLAPLVHRPEKELRKSAGGALGNIAADACIEPMRVMLADADDFVRSFGMMGISSALEHKRGSPRFRAAVFEMTVPLLTKRDMSLSKAPALLLKLDRERAIPELLSPRVLHKENPIIFQILRALNDEQVKVPGAQLDALFRDFPLDAKEPRERSIHGALLMAMAVAHHPELNRMIAAARKSPDKFLTEQAAMALALSKGSRKPESVVFEKAGKVGFKGLTVPQQHFYCVWSLSGEVNNGGFDQYYFNSAGDEANEAEAALKAIGATKTLSLLKEANGLFGLRGPSLDRGKRIRQLEDMSESKREKLSALDDQFFKDSDHLMSRLMLYVAEHAAEFK